MRIYIFEYIPRSQQISLMLQIQFKSLFKLVSYVLVFYLQNSYTVVNYYFEAVMAQQNNVKFARYFVK